jgi:hypothetical protein
VHLIATYTASGALLASAISKCVLDTIAAHVFRRHHDEVPLDQLKILVVADDASLDHSANVIDAERPTGKSLCGPGDGNVHDEDLISMISCTTVGWPLRPPDERVNRAPVNNVAASNQPAGRPLGSG